MYIRSERSAPNLKISIVAEQKYYHYFVEYINSIFYWFTKYEIGHQLLFSHDSELYQKLEKSDLIICVQMLLIDAGKIDGAKKRIMILNTEQNTRKNYFYQNILNLLESGYNILDYHVGNMEFMNRETNGIFEKQMFYLPYLYCSRDKILFKKKRKKDICFIGTLTQYRYDFLNELAKEVKIDVINDFGDRRDEILSDYKIILNLTAFENYQVFETIRCYRCIFNEILVVSEEKEYKENNFVNDMCIFSDRKNLCKTLKDVLNHYDEMIKERYCGGKEKDFISWSDERFREFLEHLK
jgi:hypothetical protein